MQAIFPFNIIHFLWRERPRLFNNPVILREVTTRFRQKASFWQLGLMLAGAGIGMVLCWWAMREQMGRFHFYSSFNQQTREIFFFLNASVTAGLMVLVPLSSGAAISLERERDTWDLLRTTNVSLGSVLLGKLLSSLLLVWLMALALAPVYAILLPVGGVSPYEIAYIFLILSIAALFIAVLGLFCSVMWTSVISSISATYVLGLMYYIGIPLFGVLLAERFDIESPAVWLVVSNPGFVLAEFFFGSPNAQVSRWLVIDPLYAHMLVTALAALILLSISFWKLSQRDDHQKPLLDRWIARLLEKREGRRSKRLLPRAAGVPDGFNAVVYKERRALRSRFGWNQLLMSLGLMLFSVIALFGFRSDRAFFWFALPMAPILVPFLVLPFACNAIRGERDRESWDLLATTTLPSSTLLLGKAYTAFQQFQFRYWLYLAFPAFFFTLTYLFGELPPRMSMADLAMNIATSYAAALFYIALGMHLSIRLRSTLSAFGWGFGIAVMLYAVLFFLFIVVAEGILRTRSEEFWIFAAGVVSPWIASLIYLDPPRDRAWMALVFPLNAGLHLWGAYVLHALSLKSIRKARNSRE